MLTPIIISIWKTNIAVVHKTIYYFVNKINWFIFATMAKEKALVKETGQILEVESTYSVKQISVSFEFETEIETLEELKGTTFVYSGDNKEEGTYYNLSDGKEYVEENLIIGLDNIRDEQINKLT